MKIRTCAMAVSLTFLGACAATAPPAPAPAPVTVASTGDPAAGVTEAQQQQFIKAAAHMGYHVEMQNNERRYCKAKQVTESHLAQKECINENQMAARLKSGQDAPRNDLPMNGGNSGVITRGH